MSVNAAGVSLKHKETNWLKGKVTKVKFSNPEKNFNILLVSGTLYRENKKSKEYVQYFSVLSNNSPVNFVENNGVDYYFYGDLERSTYKGKEQEQLKSFEVVPILEGDSKYLANMVAKVTDIPKDGKKVGAARAIKIIDFCGNDFWEKIFDSPDDIINNVKGVDLGHILTLQHIYDKFQGGTEILVELKKYGFSSDRASTIFKKFGRKSIQVLRTKPYSLCRLRGIGFKTVDNIVTNNYQVFDHIDIKDRFAECIIYILEENEKTGNCFILWENKDGILKKCFDEMSIISEDEIKKHTQTLEQVLQDIIDNDDRIQVRKIMRTKRSGSQYPTNAYYLKNMYFAEQNIADKLIRLAKNTSDIDINVIRDYITEISKETNIIPSQEQESAILSSINSKCIVITGSAGTGKTTVTKFVIEVIKRIFADNGITPNFGLVAPTGMAAKRMKEVIGLPANTIHSFLQPIDGLNSFLYNQDNKVANNVIIVDETSMVGTKLFNSLISAIPNDTTLIIVGDVEQLDSVEAGKVLKDIIDSEVIPTIRLTKIFRQSEEKLIVKSAHEVLQGKTPNIPSIFDICIKVPQDIRDICKEKIETLVAATPEWIKYDNLLQNTFFFFNFYESGGQDKFHSWVDYVKSFDNRIIKDWVTKVIEQVNTNPKSLNPLAVGIDTIFIDADILKNQFNIPPDTFLVSLLKDKIPMYIKDFSLSKFQALGIQKTKGSLSTMRVNEIMQTAFNPKRKDKTEIEIQFDNSMKYIIREGDSVIHIKNTKDMKNHVSEEKTEVVNNGEIGKIYRIVNENKVYGINSLQDGRVINYSEKQLKLLQLAYCVTVHKSQGSEWSYVMLLLDDNIHYELLNRGVIYTGMTRPKDMLFLYGSRETFSKGIQNNRTVRIKTYLKELLKEKF